MYVIAMQNIGEFYIHAAMAATLFFLGGLLVGYVLGGLKGGHKEDKK